jgi:hypothetical protein
MKKLIETLTLIPGFGVYLMGSEPKEKHIPLAVFLYEDHAKKWAKEQYSHRGDVEIREVRFSVAEDKA